MDCGECAEPFGNRMHVGLHLVNELSSEPGFICLVPQGCLGHILFFFGPEMDIYRHRRRRTSARTSAAGSATQFNAFGIRKGDRPHGHDHIPGFPVTIY